MKILIIEDEPKAAARLAEILISIDNNCEILAVIDSIEQGITWFSENEQPDIVFSDIELADGVSFDIYKVVKPTCPIVFCTAYDQYTFDAFETNAISYILKPYCRERIEAAMQKYSSMKSAFISSLDVLEDKKQYETIVTSSEVKKELKTSLIVNVGDKIESLATDNIAFVFVSTNGMEITVDSGAKYSYNSTLDELAQMLDKQMFFHANRQYVVSRKAILSVVKLGNRTLKISLNQPISEEIVISRLKSKLFLEWFER